MGKARKKGGKRAYLKRYSMSSKSNISKVGMAELYGDSSINHPTPTDINGRFDRRAPGRVLMTKEEGNVSIVSLWQGGFSQGVNRFYKTLIKDNEDLTLWLYSSGHYYLWMKLTKRTQVLTRSIVYGDRDRATRALRLNRVVWVEEGSVTHDDGSLRLREV